MQENKEFNQNEYVKDYNKKHYIQKKMYFRPDDIKMIDKYLKDNNTTLKDIILKVIKNKE